MSFFSMLRSLPEPEAEKLLNALLDRMWCNGAQAGMSERDALQRDYFEKHLSQRRREANEAVAELKAGDQIQ